MSRNDDTGQRGADTDQEQEDLAKFVDLRNSGFHFGYFAFAAATTVGANHEHHQGNEADDAEEEPYTGADGHLDTVF